MIRTSQESRERSSILEWLSPTELRFEKPNIAIKTEEGTGQWFLDAYEFNEWLLGSKKILLCTGIPGAGKTTIAVIAVDHLRSSKNTPDVGVASLFCSYERKAKQSIEGLFAALTKQLLQLQPATIAPMRDMYDSHQRQGSRPSPEELLKVLKSVCFMYTAVYIIVDALDECSNGDGARDQLIDELCQLQISTSCHLLYTSSQIPEVMEKFQPHSVLDIRANEEDVRRFLIGQIPRLPNCIRQDEQLKQEVLKQIAQKIDGM
jgi:Cdc6-like AAA superfamily ATPase